MPIHDWTKVDAGLFHDFHQRWTGVIADVLNERLLPPGYSALVESRWFEKESDVSTVRTVGSKTPEAGGAVLATKPQTSIRAVRTGDQDWYARKANRVKVVDDEEETVAVIEIVSPGNKSSKKAFRAFLDKTIEYLESGVNLLMIDLWPPTRRDPQGIHAALWDELGEDPFELPSGKNLTFVSYAVQANWEAFIEPACIGDTLPDMPLYLAADRHILVTLEPTYRECWRRTSKLTKSRFDA